ncbi:MAG: alpha/beta fold hydrolase, partial [Actinomycetes bacterium]
MNRRLLAVAVCVSLIASVVGGLVGPVAAHAASGRECDVTGESDRFPVVLIHGFATKSETIAGDWKPASDAIIAAGGQPVLFDWAGESWDWVTKKGADKRLRASIECLAAKAGGPVFVVAHSMGGLLLRAAFQDGLDTHLVAGAVTIATPHEGSLLDQTGMAELEAAVAAICLGSPAFAICAGPLGGQVNNLFSGAAAAMAAGSTEMNQLKPWPDSVPATFIAGEITLCDNTFWLKFGCENKGFDPLVKVDS